uniref:Uncharacterized protein n=1 Tax=viral metagenome TaxID=1070528 RepID=A0A6M3KU11_9ZZZZ
MPTYTRPYKRKLAKRSRTLPIYGKGEDEGKFFRCWFCGFINNKDRNTLGDAESKSGDGHTDYHGLAQEDLYRGRSISCYEGIANYQVGMELGADGEPKGIVHDHKSDISMGCAFCGSTNYAGKY